MPVAVVEKGKQPGSHLLSGAVVNPRSLRRLFRDRYRVEDMPSYGPVHGESVYVLTRRAAMRDPAAADDAQPRQRHLLAVAARPLARPSARRRAAR